MILRPTAQAAVTVMEYRGREISIETLAEDLRKECELASNGDFVRTEALLLAQAHTLDAIFHNLARNAAHSEYLNQLEANLRLALKAQSQCRATLETLTAIKNPESVAFVRQTNIAQGPQQVNNILARPGDLSRPEKTEDSQNKVLEAHSGEWLERKYKSGAQIIQHFLNKSSVQVVCVFSPLRQSFFCDRSRSF